MRIAPKRWLVTQRELPIPIGVLGVLGVLGGSISGFGMAYCLDSEGNQFGIIEPDMEAKQSPRIGFCLQRATTKARVILTSARSRTML